MGMLRGKYDVYSAPRAYTRFTLEQAVHWLYANDTYLQLPQSYQKVPNTVCLLTMEQAVSVVPVTAKPASEAGL